MTEFMQIIRSFEEYIMPMATVVDREESIRTEKSIQDNTSKAVREYVKNDNRLSRVNEKGERALTAKGELFTKMMQEELNGDATAMAGYAWLANKLGASHTPLSADLNLAEQTKKRIENVRNLVDKLMAKNEDLKYDAVMKFITSKEKEYTQKEIEEALNKNNKEYIDKIEELKKKILGNNESISDLEQKIGSLEQEMGNHMPVFNEMGIDEAEYEINFQLV